MNPTTKRNTIIACVFLLIPLLIIADNQRKKVETKKIMLQSQNFNDKFNKNHALITEWDKFIVSTTKAELKPLYNYDWQDRTFMNSIHDHNQDLLNAYNSMNGSKEKIQLYQSIVYEMGNTIIETIQVIQHDLEGDINIISKLDKEIQNIEGDQNEARKVTRASGQQFAGFMSGMIQGGASGSEATEAFVRLRDGAEIMERRASREIGTKAAVRWSILDRIEKSKARVNRLKELQGRLQRQFSGGVGINEDTQLVSILPVENQLPSITPQPQSQAKATTTP